MTFFLLNELITSHTSNFRLLKTSQVHPGPRLLRKIALKYPPGGGKAHHQARRPAVQAIFVVVRWSQCGPGGAASSVRGQHRVRVCFRQTIRIRRRGKGGKEKRRKTELIKSERANLKVTNRMNMKIKCGSFKCEIW